MSAPINDAELLAPMDDAKSAITTMAMYYFKASVASGYSREDAKQRVADMLEEVYNHYCAIGDLPPKTLGNIETRLERIMDSLKPLAKESPPLRQVYTELVALQAQVKKR